MEPNFVHQLDAIIYLTPQIVSMHGNGVAYERTVIERQIVATLAKPVALHQVD
jgi:hypothetical protein